MGPEQPISRGIAGSAPLERVQGERMTQRCDFQLQGQASPKAGGERRDEEVEQAKHGSEEGRWLQTIHRIK